MFPEEYDFMYDSIQDERERSAGICPMSDEYIDEVNQKRLSAGFSPLSSSGMADSNETWLYCEELAESRIAVIDKD